MASVYIPMDYKNQANRKLSLKIGKVTDTSILRSIKNNEANCLSKLLTYAKSAKSIYTGDIPLSFSKGITESMNLVDKEYYYVYMVLDNENGKYYPVEDVSLYQAVIINGNNSQTKSLNDYLSDKFKWNLSESEEDYFSDFSNSKTLINELKVSTEALGENKLTFVINNVVAKAEKQHKFFFYISNKEDDVPDYKSDLWKEAESYTINKDTGICTIDTGNLLKLSYWDKMNSASDLYISVYEVISDSKITSNKIEGNYKLVQKAKKVELFEEAKEPEKDPTIVPDKKLPQTGISITIISIIAISIVIAIVVGIQYKRYNIKY